MTGFDVVGDVHGYADALERLLVTLGYHRVGGVFEHPDRRVVFLGDFIDRGPEQLRTLEMARSMVDAGTALAVMGNHEFNAVAWATRVGDGWARPHSDKNRRQHQAFLDAVVEGSSVHRAWTGWFATLPMWLDLDGLRVVHACWDERSMTLLGGPALTPRATAAPKDSPLFDAIEVLLKGPEVDLGDRCYLDKDGHPRRRARFRWWDPEATTLERAAVIPGNARACDGSPWTPLPDTPIDRDALPEAITGSPVLYGHYWRNPTHGLRVDGPLSACLDWSVARHGMLAAYRWSGEAALVDDNLVAVPAQNPRP